MTNVNNFEQQCQFELSTLPLSTLVTGALKFSLSSSGDLGKRNNCTEKGVKRYFHQNSQIVEFA